MANELEAQKDEQACKYNVDVLLTNFRMMDEFIHDLAHFGITNCNGSAYQQVRLCYYEGGILLKSEHHVDHTCSVEIATDPSAEVIRGCQDSRAYTGNADPKPSVGEFVRVWYCGSWRKEGPWHNAIRDLLARLIDRLREAKEAEAQRKADEIQRTREEQAKKDAALSSAWSGRS